MDISEPGLSLDKDHYCNRDITGPVRSFDHDHYQTRVIIPLKIIIKSFFNNEPCFNNEAGFILDQNYFLYQGHCWTRTIVRQMSIIKPGEYQNRTIIRADPSLNHIHYKMMTYLILTIIRPGLIYYWTRTIIRLKTTIEPGISSKQVH